ncbi:MAG TPA: gas vesicle protein [Gemmatimonadaceae bacterium]|nr:gas vesicle protein [Gemmatimonadaceae bacterium]
MSERLLPDDEELVLSELLNHVLDKGVVIAGDVMISIADIDLVKVGLTVVITAVETLARRELAAGSPDPKLPTSEP